MSSQGGRLEQDEIFLYQRHLREETRQNTGLLENPFNCVKKIEKLKYVYKICYGTKQMMRAHGRGCDCFRLTCFKYTGTKSNRSHVNLRRKT